MQKSYNFWQLIAMGGLVTLFAAALQAAPPQAATPHTPPRISPLGQAAQVIGITGISVTYGRPYVNGRTVFGDLEPWGKVWRTGANDATVITFSSDVQVEGENLAAGTYAFFTIPEKNEWTVIFNKTAKQWGAFQYNAENDALRVRVRPRPADHQELFTIDFPEVGENETVMRLRWAQVAVPIKIRATAEKDALIRTARHAAKLPDGVGHLWEWTAYLLQSEIAVPEMAEWVERIADFSPGYYTANLKARVLARLGRTNDAISAGEEALAMGEKELGKNQFLTRETLDTFSDTLEQWRGDTK